MSTFELKRIQREDVKNVKQWVSVLQQAGGATLFHHPVFLGYHGSTFNEHHIGVFKGTTLFGVMPMAIDSNRVAKSPYGGSYGGFLFAEPLHYSESKELALGLIEYLRQLDLSAAVLTPPVRSYYKNYCETFLFALLEQGFKIVNSDITSVIQLSGANGLKFSTRTKRNIKKGQSHQISVNYNAPIADFWAVMEKTYRKHGVPPTHTREQWEWLCSNLPAEVCNMVAYFEGTPVAGIGYFKLNAHTGMSFYLASDPMHQDKQGLTFLIAETLNWLNQEHGITTFDFGTASVNMVGRDNIFQFKENFGSSGVFRHTLRYNFI